MLEQEHGYLVFNNSITLQYGKLNSSSGTIAATAEAYKTITFPITFSTFCNAFCHCNASSFTNCIGTISTTSVTFKLNNKNKQNSASFSILYWISIGY